MFPHKSSCKLFKLFISFYYLISITTFSMTIIIRLFLRSCIFLIDTITAINYTDSFGTFSLHFLIIFKPKFYNIAIVNIAIQNI